MVVVSREMPKTKSEDRKARAEDFRVQFALGLVYKGLQYGPYNTPPRELYQDKQGKKFVKISLGLYKEII